MSVCTRVGTQTQSERKVTERKERRKNKGIQRQNKGKTVQDGEVTTTPFIDDAQAHRHLHRQTQEDPQTSARPHTHTLRKEGEAKRANRKDTSKHNREGRGSTVGTATRRHRSA